MAELQDNDLLLVNRSGQSYKVTGAEVKASLVQGSIAKPTAVQTPSQNEGITDPNDAQDPDDVIFTASTPSGTDINEWNEVRWEVSENNFASSMVDIKPITDASANQVLEIDDRSNIELLANTTYQVRVRYSSNDPVVGSDYSDAITFKTGEALNPWKPITLPPPPSANGYLKLVYGEPGGQPTYLLLGYAAHFWSHDLNTWSEFNFDNNDVAHGVDGVWSEDDQQFVVVEKISAYESRRVLVSSDGINWTTQSGGPKHHQAITYGNGVYVKSNSGTTPTLYYSTDKAQTWTANNTITNSFTKLYFFNGTFIGLEGSTLYRSTDGINWSSYSFNSSQGGNTACLGYTNGYYVGMCGDLSRRTTNINNSASGWTRHNFTAEQGTTSWTGIATGSDGRLVAVASIGRGTDPSNINYSDDDGVTWNPADSPNEYFVDVIYDGKQFLALTGQGTLYVSGTGLGRKQPNGFYNQLEYVDGLETTVARQQALVARMRSRLSLPQTQEVPQAIDGYYPLYVSETEANLASSNGEAHSHDIDGVTYYMPDSGVTLYHGNYVDPAATADSSDDSGDSSY